MVYIMLQSYYLISSTIVATSAKKNHYITDQNEPLFNVSSRKCMVKNWEV